MEDTRRTRLPFKKARERKNDRESDEGTSEFGEIGTSRRYWLLEGQVRKTLWRLGETLEESDTRSLGKLDGKHDKYQTVGCDVSLARLAKSGKNEIFFVVEIGAILSLSLSLGDVGRTGHGSRVGVSVYSSGQAFAEGSV